MSNELAEWVALDQAISGAIPDDLPGYRQRYTERAIDAILAAGFHMTATPQVVETVEELQLLPQASGVLDADGMIAQRSGDQWTGDGRFYDARQIALPAQVLYPHPAPNVLHHVLAETDSPIFPSVDADLLTTRHDGEVV